MVGGLALLIACTASPRDPTGFLAPGGGTGLTGTGGGAGPVAGEWRTVIFIAVELDAQTWVTTWRFRADGGCSFRRDVTSTVEGVTRTRLRDCTWVAAGGVLTVTYLDTAEVQAMPYSFRGFNPAILILQGIEYTRIGG